jgi:hypothetical protein
MGEDSAGGIERRQAKRQMLRENRMHWTTLEKISAPSAINLADNPPCTEIPPVCTYLIPSNLMHLRSVFNVYAK